MRYFLLNILTELFNVSSFLFDNQTKTRNNLITRGTHSIRVNFCPTFLQFFLKGSHFHVGYTTGLLLQDRSYTKVHCNQIRRTKRSELLMPKGSKIVLAPVLDQSGCMKSCSILLKCNTFIWGCFLYPRTNRFF